MIILVLSIELSCYACNLDVKFQPFSCGMGILMSTSYAMFYTDWLIRHLYLTPNQCGDE
jgi:hypothetical protein